MRRYVTELQPRNSRTWYGDKTDGKNRVKSVFLAGTIDMGNSVNWQKEIVKDIRDNWNQSISYIVYNPRRDEKFEDDVHELRYQIEWELNNLENCDTIIMYIAGSSKSPITLMELGLYAASGKLVVICEENFYRFENVRAVCKRYNVEFFTNMRDFCEDWN